jgi:hypothetical protein
MTDGAGNPVTIRDIDVPFWRIVMIMIKWSIAAIPATIILIAIWVLVMTVFAALFGLAYGDAGTAFAVRVKRPSAPGWRPRRAS